MTANRLVAAAALLAVAALPSFAVVAQTKPPAPAGDGTKKKPLEQAPFQMAKSTWSRFTERELPKDRPEPSQAELAAQFGLVSLGTQGDADGSGAVHYRQPKTGMLFVFVPGGTFKMGSNYGDIYSNRMVADSAMRAKVKEDYFPAEQPQIDVYVSPFFIGVYEVTNAEYRAFLQAWRAGNLDEACEWPVNLARPNHVPFLWEDHRYPEYGADRQPIAGAYWLDAWAYCRWIGGRLPTEAEWEKAARGTDGRVFPWGNDFDPMRANTAESLNRRPVEVGTFPGGRSVYGCYDMAGNVSEYCIDSFEESLLRSMPRTNPCLLERFPVRDQRAQRGGNWNRFGLLYKSRTTARSYTKMTLQLPDTSRETVDSFPFTEYLYCGFRAVLSPMIDLFPPGVPERLVARAKEFSDQRKALLERKRQEDAKAKGAKESPAPSGPPAAPEDPAGSEGGPDGG